MVRYVSRRPKGWWGDDNWSDDDNPTREPVVEFDNREPKFTGLYDADGVPIYRLPEKVGF